MTDLRETAQQFVSDYENGDLGDLKHYARALRAALAQQEQEPVAWVDEASIAWLAEHPRGIITTRLVKQKSPERQMAMYARPPRREWRSLTEEEIYPLYNEPRSDAEILEFARAFEAALKEKNNG